MFTIATITIEGDVLLESHEDRPTKLFPHLYRLIDCRIVERRELIEAGMTLWFDEEGAFISDPQVNLLATAICEGNHVSNGPAGFIGTAVITGLPDRDGWTGLTDDQVRYIQQAAADMSPTIHQLRAEYSTPE